MTDHPFIHPDDIAAAEARGFRFTGELLPSGKTRHTVVLEQIMETGAEPITSRKVGKFPRPDSADSPTALSNKHKRDIHRVDAAHLTSIDHANIVKLHTCFPGKYGLITIEDEVRGEDLSRYVRRPPSMRRNEYASLARQMIKPVRFLNMELKIAHRDLKPGNFLRDKSGRLRLSDLQNAGSLEGMVNHSLPTKGGTDVTMPQIINAYLQGKPARAGLRSEAYSISACLYHLATGEMPFDYKLVFADDGNELRLDPDDLPLLRESGEIAKVQLLVDGDPVSGITDEMHLRRLKGLRKKMPKDLRIYWPLIEKGLQSQYRHIGELQDDFERIDGGLRRAIGDLLLEHEETAGLGGLAVLLAGTLVLGIGIGGKWFPREQPVYDAVEHPVFFDPFPSSFVTGQLAKDYHGIDILVPRYRRLRAEVERDGDPRARIDLTDEKIAYLAMDTGVNKQLFLAVLRTGHNNSQRLPYDREAPFFLESDYGFYMPRRDREGGWTPEKLAAMQLKLSERGGGLTDIFARYFCDDDVIRTSQTLARNMNFWGSRGSSYRKGYGFLLGRCGDLAEEATLWYLITNEDGVPHFVEDIGPKIANNGLDVR